MIPCNTAVGSIRLYVVDRVAVVTTKIGEPNYVPGFALVWQQNASLSFYTVMYAQSVLWQFIGYDAPPNASLPACELDGVLCIPNTARRVYLGEGYLVFGCEHFLGAVHEDSSLQLLGCNVTFNSTSLVPLEVTPLAAPKAKLKWQVVRSTPLGPYNATFSFLFETDEGTLCPYHDNVLMECLLMPMPEQIKVRWEILHLVMLWIGSPYCIAGLDLTDVNSFLYPETCFQPVSPANPSLAPQNLVNITFGTLTKTAQRKH